MFYTDKIENKESKALEKIQMKHLIIAYLILGVGWLVAMVVFMLEMYLGKKVQEVQQQ